MPISAYSLAPAARPVTVQPVLVPGRPPSRRNWSVAAVLVLLCAGAGWALRVRLEAKSASHIATPTARAFRGLLLRTVRLTGNVTATHFADIFAPSIQAPDAGRGLVLTYLPPSGSMVQKGQKIVEIDSQSVRDHLDDVEAAVNQSEMDLRKLKARQVEETEAFRQGERAARGAVEQAEQNMRALAVRNTIDQEKLRLTVEEAKATYAESQRQVALTADRQVAATQIQEIAQELQVHHRDRHRHDLAEFTIFAPMAGQVVMKPIWRAGDRSITQVGDMVSPAQPILRIADLSTMELEATMNQAESELVHMGQRVILRFDAWPGMTLPGRVVAIGTLASSGRRVNYFVRSVSVRIAIEGSDPRMIVDSSASADVVLEEQDNLVIIPRQAVVEEEGRPVVYVKQEGGFTAREVELGTSNHTEVAVLSGLQAGEEIALGRPY